MEIVLSGLIINGLTYIAKYFGLSGTVMSVLFSLLAGIIYYVFITYYPATYESIIVFVSGAYATSQLVYNIVKELYNPVEIKNEQ